MERGQADALITELGQALGIAELALDDSGTCTLFIDDGAVVVNIGHNAVAKTIDLMVCLDAVEPGSAPLNRLLQANFAWRGSLGATFAIEPASGALVLQRRVAAVDAGELQQTLEELVTAAEAWAKQLGADGAPAAQAEQVVVGIRA